MNKHDIDWIPLHHALQLLLAYGFFLSARNNRVLPGVPGAFMVVDDIKLLEGEYLEATGDYYAAVGNDVPSLLREAAGYVLGYFDAADKALANIRAGKTGVFQIDEQEVSDE